RIVLRRPGYRPAVKVVDTKAYKDEDARMIASITTKLAVAQRPTESGTTGGDDSTDDGSGSETTPNGNGSGSTTNPTGSGTTGTGTTGTSSTGTGTTGTG